MWWLARGDVLIHIEAAAWQPMWWLAEGVRGGAWLQMSFCCIFATQCQGNEADPRTKVQTPSASQFLCPCNTLWRIQPLLDILELQKYCFAFSGKVQSRKKPAHESYWKWFLWRRNGKFWKRFSQICFHISWMSMACFTSIPHGGPPLASIKIIGSSCGSVVSKHSWNIQSSSTGTTSNGSKENHGLSHPCLRK